MKFRRTKTLGTFFVILALLATSFLTGISAVAAATYDYKTTLGYSIQFFDANKCGKDVALNNVFSWRGACHTSDGSDKGLDLTGGFHDAGDHVKFGLAQGFSAAVLGWSLYEYKDIMDSTGNTNKLLSTLKYFTDYFLKSHPNSTTFYYQVGDGDVDHAYWGAPENQTGSRPTMYVADASRPASDVLGETSAALSLMYLNYKSVDLNYANKCLLAAKELYTMGRTNLGVGEGQTFYKSGGYYDDLAWAAVWLYVATNESQYLTQAEQFVAQKNIYGDDPFRSNWSMCWDDMYLPVHLKLAQITGKQQYKDAMTYNLNYWKNSLTTTPGGLKYLNNWGVLRYAAAESMLALLYYEQTKDETLKTFAKSQIDYILGKNPANMSYIIGYGTNYPKHPHHRAANGYTYATGGITNEAKHVLLGSLVGGPDATDTYKDDVNQYQYTEVALDYNAGLVGALAGMQKNYGGTVSSPSPAATPTATPSIKPTATPSPSVAPTPTATPSSVPVSKTIPGTIEAENYDNMYGIQTESCVEGGLNVGWIDTGDWLDYNVNVQSEGTYTVEYRVASTQSTGKLALRKGTVNLASSSIPNTGGWQNWTTIKATVNLSAGTQTLRLYAEGSLFNINWIKFTSGSVSTASPTPTPTPTITPSIVPTPTSTPSIVPTPTKTPVPSVTPTSTPTPSASTAPVSGSIKVQMYNGNTSSSTNGIAPKFMITNTGTTSISLESVKIRYYYTIDGDKAQSFWCDWTSVGSSNVTGRFVKMSTAKTTADYYLEVGFISTAGSLSPGQSIEVQTRFSKSDWSNYNQSNDYSFRSTGTSYSDWNKVTGYVSGILNWGVEP